MDEILNIGKLNKELEASYGPFFRDLDDGKRTSNQESEEALLDLDRLMWEVDTYYADRTSVSDTIDLKFVS